MIHETEPCASLPKLHVTIRATWCEHHQAWTLAAHTYREDGRDISDVVPYTELHFGPFDSTNDVLTSGAQRLRDGLQWRRHPHGAVELLDG